MLATMTRLMTPSGLRPSRCTHVRIVKEPAAPLTCTLLAMTMDTMQCNFGFGNSVWMALICPMV